MMMQGLRNAGQTWLGKLVVTVLFGMLILSFAIWGVGDMFRGYGLSTAAKVGSTEISIEQLRFTYQGELQRLSRQTRGAISSETARRLGFDQAVVSRLIAEAAMDERARQLGLNISDQAIADAILNDPNFKGPDGKFTRALFDNAIRDAGFTEARFVAEQRKVYLRQQLSDGITGGVTPPAVLKEMAYRLANETRSVEYVVLPADKIVAATPDDAALQKYFDERKASFRAPEYRAISVLALNADAIAKPGDVSDADARKRYDETRTVRFGSPERRSIRVMRFPSMEEAKAASEKIKGGATFAAIAAERNIADKDLDLGRLTKREVADGPVGDAAFALAKDAVSEPVSGQFGPALVTVIDIEAENVRPFEDVVADLKREIARERAQQNIREAHDKIEDQRASAKPLAEVAQSLNLTLRAIEAVDRQGRDRAGAAIANLPEREALLQRAFASDVGADNEPISTRDNGYVWFDVTKVEPERDRTLDEARNDVVARFKQDDIARQLSEKAAALAKRIEGGETLATVAAAEGLGDVKLATGLKRDAAMGDISRSAAVQIFAAPVGRVLTAPAENNAGRLVLRITDAIAPPFVNTTQAAAQLDEQLRTQIGQDLLASYVGKLRADLGVVINPEGVRLAIGGDAPAR